MIVRATSGSPVLPAHTATNLCQNVSAAVLRAFHMALGVGLIGFGFANHCDYPSAQMIVALLIILLITIWRCRRMRQSLVEP